MMLYSAVKCDYTPVYVFAAAIVHEFGHLTAMKICGVKLRGLSLHAGGAVIDSDRMNVSYPAETVICLSGAAANLAAAAVSALAGAPETFTFANIALAAFNLLPIRSLDGFNAMRAVFYMRTDDFNAAERALDAVSYVFLVLFWLASCFIQFKAGGNLCMLAVSMYLLFRAVK